MSETPRVLLLIPYYNHERTLRGVVEKCLRVLDELKDREFRGWMLDEPLVVDDGSTAPASELLQGIERARVLRLPVNVGKAAALRAGALQARALGATHLLTLDADAQHDPEDIPKFLAALAEGPRALHVGARDLAKAGAPKASRFGCAFSNFWLRVQTGVALADSQSGFRLYPLELFEELNLTEQRFAFETEILVKAAWAGIPLKDVPIRVNYRPPGGRVSHFRALEDNARIAWLNTRLTLRCMLPWPHRKLIANAPKPSLAHPWRTLKLLLATGATPRQVALGAALGVGLGALPLFGVQTVLVLALASYLRLSKGAALAANQLCMPPLAPALAVELGYFFRHGRFLTEVSLQTLGYEAGYRLWEWLLGGLVLGPVLALLLGALVYAAARALSGRRASEQENSPQLADSPARWSSRSIASRFQHGFFYALIRLAGRCPAYAFLHLVTAWYTLFRPSIRRRTYHYLTRRFPQASGAALLRHSYRLCTAFGKSLVDRAAVGILGPQSLDVDFPQAQELRTLLAEGKGVVLMTAHVGGWQAAMPGVDFLDAPVNMLLQRAQDDVDRHWYEHAQRERPFRTIDPAGYLGGSLEMLAALKRGELLCVMGDRVLGSERNVVAVEFLGQDAAFPVSAYRVAAAAGAPIAVLLARKVGARRYELSLPAVIRVPDGLGRNPLAYRPYAAAYAAALERFAMENPYQFYNFHDMWV